MTEEGGKYKIPHACPKCGERDYLCLWFEGGDAWDDGDGYVDVKHANIDYYCRRCAEFIEPEKLGLSGEQILADNRAVFEANQKLFPNGGK